MCLAARREKAMLNHDERVALNELEEWHLSGMSEMK